jgi:hypothetical protein
VFLRRLHKPGESLRGRLGFPRQAMILDDPTHAHVKPFYISLERLAEPYPVWLSATCRALRISQRAGRLQ